MQPRGGIAALGVSIVLLTILTIIAVVAFNGGRRPLGYRQSGSGGLDGRSAPG